MNIRFIDIQTGNLFDGSQPYVFWFPGEQSTGLIYSHKICFVSKESQLKISIPESDIFKLIDSSRFNSSGLGYQDLYDLVPRDNFLISRGYFYQGFYVHMIYVVGSASQPGEYIESIFIGDEEIHIGADFYGENESLYINLANNGVEIPNYIQKAFFESDVHEDNKDNILLNRKFKELLINLSDVVSNRGSYKSLFNSLRWFEYGDILKLKEVWMGPESRTQYMLRDVKEVLEEKYAGILYESKKTSYLGLGLALQEIIRDDDGNIIYDNEKNPTLTNISSRWSIEDLSLKMSILGNFYQTYFMPIHLNLIHSTIENIVYGQTIKTVVAGLASRVDRVGNFESTSIKMPQSVLKLKNVQVYVTPDTFFGMQYGVDFSSDDKISILGVQKNPIGKVTNNSLKTYASQLYKAPGAVAEFNIELPEFLEGEFIKLSKLIIDHYSDGVLKNTIIKEDARIITENKFTFHTLHKYPGDYKVRMQFTTNSDRTFVKKTSFMVVDSEHIDIKVCKIVNNGTTRPSDENINNYVFRMQMGRTDIAPDELTKYIPASYPSKNAENVKGVRLNHVIILEKKSDATNPSYDKNDYLISNYYIRDPFRSEVDQNSQYLVCISKMFETEEDRVKIDKSLNGYKIHSSRYLYIPQFHHMEELAGQKATLEQYTITDQDALCVTADLKFSKYIKDASWEFVNVSKLNPEEFTIKDNVREPFIAKGTPSPLDPGYYNIVFKYSLIGEDKVNKVTLESAFIKR